MTEGLGRHRPKAPVAGMFASNEELGKLSKKDDDHRPARVVGGHWHPPRRRKLMYTVVGLVLLWLIYHWHPRLAQSPVPSQQEAMPIPSVAFRAPIEETHAAVIENKLVDAVYEAAAAVAGAKTNPEHSYNGDIEFYALPSTIRPVAKATFGLRKQNRNVLFAASSLKSLANMIPLACQMSRYGKNYVHLAVMGRHDVPLNELKQINGVDTATCTLYWHDARPNRAAESTDIRAEVAVDAALGHIHGFLHPQVLITDDLLIEDSFFASAIRADLKELGLPRIELPLSDVDRFMWVARLDVAALVAWHKPNVDILIQASQGSVGTLMRLLNSLAGADYAGLAPPRLIIELPSELDVITQFFLNSFSWPPLAQQSGKSGNKQHQLILRRKIPTQRVSPEEASIRFLESFYPANMVDSHVLILSPHVQVSPLYYQYIFYHLLEYRYSSFPSAMAPVMGISLELPSVYLNGTDGFALPENSKIAPTVLRHAKPTTPNFRPPFQWQAPNTNAALYFGDKWIEAHSFLSHRLSKFHSSGSSTTPQEKLVSTDHPAWAEYFLELIRARGYYMLYPGAADASRLGSDALVTTHTEHAIIPDEFLGADAKQDEPKNADAANLALAGEPFKAPPSPQPKKTRPAERKIATHGTPLELMLPFQGEPPDLAVLPRISFDGYGLTHRDAAAQADEFAAAFRESVGGCPPPPPGRRRRVRPGSAADLFCYGGEADAPAEWERPAPAHLMQPPSPDEPLDPIAAAVMEEVGRARKEAAAQAAAEGGTVSRARGTKNAEDIVQGMREGVESLVRAAKPDTEPVPAVQQRHREGSRPTD